MQCPVILTPTQDAWSERAGLSPRFDRRDTRYFHGPGGLPVCNRGAIARSTPRRMGRLRPADVFFFGIDGKPAAREALRTHLFGRIASSHSNLTGAMDHRNALMGSHRAIDQLVNRILTY
jgi:hypothetical protein